MTLGYFVLQNESLVSTSSYHHYIEVLKTAMAAKDMVSINIMKSYRMKFCTSDFSAFRRHGDMVDFIQKVPNLNPSKLIQ